MRNLVFFLFVFFFPFFSEAQNLQPGTRLDYISTPFFWMPPLFDQSIFSLEITGDTLVQGKTYLQVPEYFCNFANPTLIREEGSKVYYYLDGEDYLLYDYSLNPGDTLWQTYWNSSMYEPGYELTTYPLRVIDTLSALLGGVWRKVQYISYEGPTGPITNDIGGMFIEDFGSAYFFFPQDALCESILCLRAIYWPNGDSTMVDSLTNCFFISDTKEKDLLQKLTISPNPVQEVLHLVAEPALHSEAAVVIFDLYGREVYNGIFSEAEKGISTQTWPTGIYHLKVRDDGKVGTVRFVKVLSF